MEVLTIFLLFSWFYMLPVVSTVNTLLSNQKREISSVEKGGGDTEMPLLQATGDTLVGAGPKASVCGSAAGPGTPRLGEEKLWKRSSKPGFCPGSAPGRVGTPGRSLHFFSLELPSCPLQAHQGCDDPQRCQMYAAPSSPCPMIFISNLIRQVCGPGGEVGAALQPVHQPRSGRVERPGAYC